MGCSFRKGEKYKPGENRVTIWIRREFMAEQRPDFCNSHSTICVATKTPLGDLNIYGTVIGIYGHESPEFEEELEIQIGDWQRLHEIGDVCIADDFNISFVDGFYLKKSGRLRVKEIFDQLHIEILTQNTPNNIDHIAFSESLKFSVHSHVEWNEGCDGKLPDKNTSDHMGVCLTLRRS
jgi:hypothetical protein